MKNYALPAYAGVSFNQGAATADALILIGSGFPAAGDAAAGLVHRLNLNGELLWTYESAPEGGDVSITDVCVTPSGQIVLCVNSVQYEEDGFPAAGSGNVLCLDMDGKLMWEHPLSNSRRADDILPVPDGFLAGNRGLDLEGRPWPGAGWLLALGADGREMDGMALPDIGGGTAELLGMAPGVTGEVLLFGARLDEPGTVTGPYLARIGVGEGKR